ncbi:Serine/threonine protein kinase [Mucilaginibacter pineti]|uniref:Serine/threonine protein kinase n=1 Tax=Mucilaginibacter pineti TaxID=1391627 RepID=A0A1G7JP24_9SPHI|nr:protein kinase [Mucilaginibacter pineti]SDF26708.1 Serine/threonine protein kinase [Mucilaginibacter pineti]
MEKAFNVHLINYAPILKSAGIRFKEDEKTLMVGKASADVGYVILISSRTLDAPKLLQTILPILKKSRAAYRIIKSQQDQYRLNAGAFGDEEAGKVVSIFPNDIAEAKSLLIQLKLVTEKYKGPSILKSQRVSEVIYIQRILNKGHNDFKLIAPDIKNFPFEFPKQYKKRKSTLNLIGKAYLPIQLLRTSTKGNIYKAINLKRLKFDWCLIKQGNPVALDDHFDRDMKDRLQWQKEVHEFLRGKVYTPDVIDHFSSGDYHYLVFNYAEGDSLGNVISDALVGKKWIDLDRPLQQKLLGYFIQAVELVKSIHEAGIVHRDVTDSNLIVLDDGKLCIIDFELSYSFIKCEPNPPFLLGTFGYVAPEQIQHAVPDPAEDIYSLGALLCFVMTGCKTSEFIGNNHQQLKVKLFRLTGEKGLCELVMKCLSYSRSERPDIEMIIATVQNQLLKTLTLNHEKASMAV